MLVKLVKLVPPTIRALAIALTRHVDVTKAVDARMRVLDDRACSPHYNWGTDYQIEWFGQDLAVAITSNKNGRLVWLVEVRCHSLCAIMGFCIEQMCNESAFLAALEKKHNFVLDQLVGV